MVGVNSGVVYMFDVYDVPATERGLHHVMQTTIYKNVQVNKYYLHPGLLVSILF